MNYQNPQLLGSLAGEYVLGTLHGRARRRFERLMVESYRARTEVWRWEGRLCPLALGLVGVQPAASVWRRINQRTGGEESVGAPWYERLGLWRGLALAASAAVLVLALMLRTPTAPAAQYVAVFSDEQSQALWVVSADLTRSRLSITPVNVVSPATDQAYELWVLPADGAAPRSLGLMSATAAVERELSGALNSLMSSAQTLAISLEPSGGSPTGAPTGPVVHQAALLRISG